MMKPKPHNSDFIPDLKDIQSLFGSISTQLDSSALASRASPKQSGKELLSSFQQFLSIVHHIESSENQSGPDISIDELTEIGELGLQLLQQINNLLRPQQKADLSQTVNDITLGVTHWILNKGGRIGLLEPIVDAIAARANSTSNQRTLSQMVDFMNRLTAACADIIKHDLEMGNPGRPWLLLQINRGIAATRSHDTQSMIQVFDELLVAIPQEAPRFFAEGMREMDAQNYPDFVHDVMTEYYEKHSEARGH